MVRLRLLVVVSLLLLVSSVTIGHQPVEPPTYTDADFRWYEPPPVHEVVGAMDVIPTPDPAPTLPRETAKPRPTKHEDTLGGLATWHATGRDGLYAAAGPALRSRIGRGWRGSYVLVCSLSSPRCVAVTLNDWCACGPRRGFDTLLDLSDEAFAYLAPLSRGVLRVAVDIP